MIFPVISFSRWAAAIGCALMLAACGGGGSASSSAASAGTGPSSSSGGTPVPLPPPPSPAPSPTPPTSAAQYLASSSYPASGPQPYKFLVTAPGGPIPASLQPYEVWPSVDASGNLYFNLDVSTTGPWGGWTSAQLQIVTVAALDSNGWTISQ
jgi:hypothetical protein